MEIRVQELGKGIFWISSITLILGGFLLASEIFKIDIDISNNSIRFDTITGEPFRILFSSVTAILSGFSAAVFIRFWIKFQTFNEDKLDMGLFYLASAMAVWSLLNVLPSSLYDTCAPYGSTINNIFFLNAVFYFEYGKPNFNWYVFKKLGIKRENFILLCTSIGIIIILIFLVFDDSIGEWFEFVFSLITALFLGRGLFLSFIKRNFPLVAFLSILAIGVTISAQIFDSLIILGYFENSGTALSYWTILKFAYLLAFKVILIFLIGALAISWVDSKQLRMLSFQRRDMIHLIRNTLKFLKDDFELQKEIITTQDELDRKKFLEENTLRIEVLRDLFDIVYYSKNPYGVSLEFHLSKVIKKICDFFHYDNASVSLNFNGLPEVVNSESATHLSKIITELLINNYKYGGRWFRLSGFYSVNQEQVIIEVEDRGKGYKDSDSKEGFGKKLIDQYTDELKGILTIESTNTGSIFKLKLPVNQFLYTQKKGYYEDTTT